MNASAKVGLFFLVAIVLAGILIFKIQDLHLGQAEGKTVTIVFQNAAGLDTRAAVRVAGVRVGQVAKIRLIEGRAYVSVSLESGVDLRQGASATIANMGLLGEKYLELIPGPVGNPELPDDAVIAGNQAVSFDQVTQLARDIELDVKSITASLRSALGGPQGEATTKAIVGNIEQITADLKAIVASNRENVNETAANLRQFSAVLVQLTDRVNALVAANSGNTTATIDNIRAITDKLQHTADNLNAITDKINEGKGTIGQLVNNPETSKNLNDALTSVKEGVNSLNKTLTKVNKIKVDLALRTEYLTSPGKGKSYFTADIIPDQSHFYRLGIATEPFGINSETTTTYTTTMQPGGSPQVTTITKNEVNNKALGFTALFGFNFFNDLTLRAGMEESRGGGGIDYWMLHRRLEFSGDMWDFDRGNSLSPHAKIGGRYYLSPSTFVSAGWDDFLNRGKGMASVFFGGGVRWNDDDIKLLLGSLPTRF